MRSPTLRHVLAPLLPALLLVAGPAGAGKKLPDPLRDEDFHFNGEYSDAKVQLGRVLFFDKLLSGNQNISCATCHHALLQGGDGLSLSTGEGARGLGLTRDLGEGPEAVLRRVPRNAMPLWNLGHESLTAAFHDGRVEVDPSQPSGYRTAAGDAFPQHVDTVMAAQAFFPVASNLEMAGDPGENVQADLAQAGDYAGVWDHVVGKLRAIPAYVDLFTTVYFGDPVIPVSEASDITYVHVANAIFAWEASVFRSDATPFDRFLEGDKKALSKSAKKGMKLFFGKAGCSGCHAGALLSDSQFRSIGMPQIGPGMGDGSDGHEDFGRERVTGDAADRYRFRTPPLRNVALSPPYGHDGAYHDLESVIRHHLDPPSLSSWLRSRLALRSRPDLDAIDFLVMDDPVRAAAIAASHEVPPLKKPLKDEQIRQLVDFLAQGLTDPAALDLRDDVPATVPSGLPVAD